MKSPVAATVGVVTIGLRGADEIHFREAAVTSTLVDAATTTGVVGTGAGEERVPLSVGVNDVGRRAW
jgi:hypothetical protein